MSTWIEDPTGLIEDAGDVGGDAQVGPAFERRFVNPELEVYLTPGHPRLPSTVGPDRHYALVTVQTYAIRHDPTHDDGCVSVPCGCPEGELDVQECIEWLVCTDPDDPGGTEVWSDCAYEHGKLDGTVITGGLEEANQAARERVEAWTPDLVGDWDGRPFDVHGGTW